MKYLITGGTGFVGKNFIKDLDLNKDSIIVFSRRKKQTANNVKVITSFEEIHDNAMIDVIINLAGSPIDRRWTQTVKRDLSDSRINTTHGLITLIDRLLVKPTLMISASAIGYYGSHNSAVLDEDSQPNESFTHSLCDKWEKEAKKAETYGVRVCIARLGVVLGRQGGFIKKVALPFKLGLGGNLGKGNQFFSWVHLDDVIGVFNYLIEHKECQGAYNIVSPEAVTNKQLTQSLGKILKRPAFMHIPESLVRLLFGEMGEALLLKGNKIYPKRLIEAGYQFAFQTIEDALSNAC